MTGTTSRRVVGLARKLPKLRAWTRTAAGRDVVVWIVLIAGVVVYGLFWTYQRYRSGFGLGDGSTFYQFARNLARGEAIYTDFIHFRTPGSYFLQALAVRVFGDQYSSVSIALLAEARVLFMGVFGLSLAVLLRWRRPLIGAATLLPVMLLPAYMQLRTAFAFAAVVAYIQARRMADQTGRVGYMLLAAGVLAGLSFAFGQEAGVLAVLVIGAAELVYADWGKYMVVIRRVGWLVVGFLVGVLPLLMYVLLNSSLGNFLYYTIYYAFVLQPKGMDIPYPNFQYSSLLYYLPLVLLVGVFYVLYNYKKSPVTHSVLLGFMILRFITLFGRSDKGHLIFVLPELLFLTVYALCAFPRSTYSWAGMRRFLLPGLAFTLSLGLAVKQSSLWAVVAMFVVLAAFRYRNWKDKPVTDSEWLRYGTFAVLVACSALLVYMLVPDAKGTLKGLRSRQALSSTSLSGANVTPKLLNEVTSVAALIIEEDPETLFSFPIQPYYYIYAPQHAARFLTFEPQTTEREQDQTIEDLERTKPEVIVFDPSQAAELSAAVWKISDYILSNYVVKDAVQGERVTWVMTPRSSVADSTEPIVFDAVDSEAVKVVEGTPVFSPEKKLYYGLLQKPGQTAIYRFSSLQQFPAQLQLSVYLDKKQDYADCGQVTIAFATTPSLSTKVCASSGQVDIRLTELPTSVTFDNPSTKQLIWDDPVLTR